MQSDGVFPVLFVLPASSEGNLYYVFLQELYKLGFDTSCTKESVVTSYIMGLVSNLCLDVETVEIGAAGATSLSRGLCRS